MPEAPAEVLEALALLEEAGDLGANLGKFVERYEMGICGSEGDDGPSMSWLENQHR